MATAFVTGITVGFRETRGWTPATPRSGPGKGRAVRSLNLKYFLPRA